MSRRPHRPVVVLGAGGHARVVIDALKNQGERIMGCLSNDPHHVGQTVLDASVIGTDDALEGYSRESVVLANGIGMVRAAGIRRALFERWVSNGFEFTTVIHSSAVISDSVELAEGVQVMAGAVVQVLCRIGRNTIVNTNASVDHDCDLASHVHVAPGAVISGDVRIGEGTHVGAGAVILQGLQVGADVTIGAGAVVVKDIPDGVLVRGVPASIV